MRLPTSMPARITADQGRAQVDQTRLLAATRLSFDLADG